MNARSALLYIMFGCFPALLSGLPRSACMGLTVTSAQPAFLLLFAHLRVVSAAEFYIPAIMSNSGVTRAVKPQPQPEHDVSEEAMAAMRDGAEDDLHEASHSGEFDFYPNGWTEEPVTEDTTEIVKKKTRPANGQCNPRGKEVSVVKVDKGWVARTSAHLQYMHMPTVSTLASGGLLVAWQGAAKGEGGSDQAVYYAVSENHGHSWSHPKELPGKHVGARWSPVVFRPEGVEKAQMLYTEGRSCWHCSNSACKDHMKARLAGKGGGGSHGPHWRAGGDIYAVTTRTGKDWSSPRRIFNEEDDGPIPKVIANPPAVRGSTWVLPYWRQNPRGAAQCKTKGNDYAGVLISSNAGQTWTPHGKIVHPGAKPDVDRLIEGALVFMPPNGTKAKPSDEMFQIFRTTRDTTYTSTSLDGGRTWQKPQKNHLPNPNTKSHMIVLSNGVLVAAYNHHKYKLRQRSMLFLSTSHDRGATWHPLAKLETKFGGVGAMLHYPTMLQVGCKLLVVYSDHKRGIRFVTVHLHFE